MPHCCLCHGAELASKGADYPRAPKSLVDPENLQSAVSPLSVFLRLHNDLEVIFVQFKMPPGTLEEGGSDRPRPRHAIITKFFQPRDVQSERIGFSLMAQSNGAWLAGAALRMRILVGFWITDLTPSPFGFLFRWGRHRLHHLATVRAHAETFGAAQRLAALLLFQRAVIDPPNRFLRPQLHPPIAYRPRDRDHITLRMRPQVIDTLLPFFFAVWGQFIRPGLKCSAIPAFLTRARKFSITTPTTVSRTLCQTANRALHVRELFRSTPGA